jgi:hypothetical protein
MKQWIGCTASEVLFCLGDWISRPMSHWDWAWLYPAYNWLMDASYRTQIWANSAGPWQSDTTKKENK